MLLRHESEIFHHFEARRGVKATSWFIEEQNLWCGD